MPKHNYGSYMYIGWGAVIRNTTGLVSIIKRKIYLGNIIYSMKMEYK